jgi:hypothetical protein
MVSGEMTGDAAWIGTRTCRAGRGVAAGAPSQPAGRVFSGSFCRSITLLITPACSYRCAACQRSAGDLSLGEIGVSGTTLTMDRPRLTGYGAGGMSYDVTAARALQDLTARRSCGSRPYRAACSSPVTVDDA